MTITYSECVFVALAIRHAMRMRLIVICVLSPLYRIFPHYLINGTIFWKKVTEHKMRVLIFSTLLSETFLILRRNGQDMTKKLYWGSCKVPLFLSDLNET
jgi:hypothetical protein